MTFYALNRHLTFENHDHVSLWKIPLSEGTQTEAMKRKEVLFHPIPKKNHIYVTRKHPHRYCKRVIMLLREYPAVELFASGAAINTLCCIKMEVERQLYLPIEVPNLITKISCELKTFTLQQSKTLNGMQLTIRKS